MAEGETHQFDIAILRALRSPADPSKLIGPGWLEGCVDRVTALGSSTVLGVVILAVVGFLLLQERYQTAGFVGITALSGMLVSTVLKDTFNRPRPSVVPHLRDVVSTSFPSGHAMQSAIVYLTIGAVLMRAADRRATKLYCLGLAMLLTLLVGISRVSLGVHYPTDVIGGWIIGFVWASMCWLIAQRFSNRRRASMRSAGNRGHPDVNPTFAVISGTLFERHQGRRCLRNPASILLSGPESPAKAGRHVLQNTREEPWSSLVWAQRSPRLSCLRLAFGEAAMPTRTSRDRRVAHTRKREDGHRGHEKYQLPGTERDLLDHVVRTAGGKRIASERAVPASQVHGSANL